MERTSNVTLRIGVQGGSNPGAAGPGSPGSTGSSSGVGATTSTTPGDGSLSNTGVSLYAVGGVVALLLSLGLIVFFVAKRKRHSWGIAARRSTNGIMAVSALAVVSLLTMWGVKATATPVMDIRSSISSATMNLEADGAAQSVQNTVDLAANSSTGYALEARVANSNLPGGGANISVSGGDATVPAVVTSGSQTRLVTRSGAASQSSVPVTIAAKVDSSIPTGEYEVTLQFTVKALPSSDQATQMSTINNLMSSQPASNSIIKLNEFNSNDQVQNIYKVVDTLPNNRVLSRISVPLANGKYALPQALNTKLPEPNSSQRVSELLEVAQTYVDAGAQLKWDSGRDTPLQSVEPIHTRYTAPYALTCSSFANMVLAAWKYSDTTYVANSNTASYSWGTNFNRPAGTQPPFQAWKLLRWMDWQGRAAVYTPGVDNYQPGDLLFFSKQEPEGPGTDGEYYMNVYHVSIYMGNNRVVHSISPDTGNGVVIQDLNQALKNDLTFVARPNLGQ